MQTFNQHIRLNPTTKITLDITPNLLWIGEGNYLFLTGLSLQKPTHNNKKK